MKEFRLTAFALKKITMTAYAVPTFFSFKTFLIPLFLKRECRKKKAQTQMGNDSQSKKKVSGFKRQGKGNFLKKRSKAR